jgi:hypothetical protein
VKTPVDLVKVYVHGKSSLTLGSDIKMTGNELPTRIKSRLFPEPYDCDISPAGSFEFLIKTSPILFNGRYAVGFKQLKGEITYDHYLDVRTEAQRLCKALWLFREVGIHLIFCGPERYWKDKIKDISADITGVHCIIVQAIHFIDPNTRASHVSRSTWGLVKFGNGGLVSKIVEEELNRNTNNRLQRDGLTAAPEA